MSSNQERRGGQGVGRLEEDLPGGQRGHVTVYAVLAENQAGHLGLCTIIVSLPRMTAHASARKQAQVVGLLLMNIMARGAIHFAQSEAFAGGKQSILVAVNVQRRIVRGAVRVREIFQVIAHGESKGRHEILSETRMTKSAVVESLLPR